MKTFNYHSYIFLSLVSMYYSTHAYQQENKTAVPVKTSICEVNRSLEKSLFFLNCTINLTFHEISHDWRFPSGCFTTEDSDFGMSIIAYSQPTGSINYNATCVSNLPIFVKVGSSELETDVAAEYLNIQWKRIVPEYSNISTYNYQFQIIFPTNNFPGTTLVKYTIFSKHVPNKDINILWFRSAYTDSIFMIGKDTEIMATDEILTVPCIHADPSNTKKLHHKASQRTVSLDNSVAYYNPAYGYRINTTLLQNWKSSFYCQNHGYTEDSYSVTVTSPPDFSWRTELNHLFKKPPALRTPFHLISKENMTHTLIGVYDNEINQKQEFILICSSTIVNVTFHVPTDLKNVFEVVTLNPTMDITYIYKEKPQTQYTVQTNVNVDFSKLFNRSESEEAFVDCVHPITYISIHKWVFKQNPFSVKLQNTTQKGSNPTNSTSKEMNNTVPYLQIQIDTLECYNGLMSDDVDFRQFECNDLFSCKEFAEAIFKSGESKVTNVYEGSPCDQPDLNGHLRCKALTILKKGFFQCTVDKEAGIYQDYYFIGFDKNIYIGNVNPPDSAIIKIEMNNQTESSVLFVPGHFNFCCQAHSFHFEHGIKWLLVYQNGMEIEAPSENIVDVNTTDINDGNPVRISNIYLENQLVKQVKCAAPLQSILNDNYEIEWKYASINLALKDSMAPRIETAEQFKVKYFEVGKANQSLNCIAKGMPLPEITWNVRKKESESPLTLTKADYNLLHFPLYDESFEGEYVCIARNRFGIANATFTVYTSVNNSTSACRNLIIAILFCVVLAINF